jgi:hypothetical protein
MESMSWSKILENNSNFESYVLDESNEMSWELSRRWVEKALRYLPSTTNNIPYLSHDANFAIFSLKGEDEDIL